jgi:predicted phosphodiesterase
MRYAILADIHANLASLEAVLEDIDNRGGVDGLWCLGDIVGYGPQPVECIRCLRERNPICVAGNHDLGAIGGLDLFYFNPTAATACRWTGEMLGKEEIDYLAGLPLYIVQGRFYLVHGSPSDPALEYIISTTGAEKNFLQFNTQYCLVGHTHVPMVFRQTNDDPPAAQVIPGESVKLGNQRLIINPGSVGQPRDGDPRAAYAILDDTKNTLRIYRVVYDIAGTQEKMFGAGLPFSLISRLEAGR